MKWLKLALIGVPIASTVPFVALYFHTIFTLSSRPSMSPEKAGKLIISRFPGKQLNFLCNVIGSLWVLPFALAKKPPEEKKPEGYEVKFPLYLEREIMRHIHMQVPPSMRPMTEGEIPAFLRKGR